MDRQARMYVIRGLNAELVYVRTPFPKGPKGLVLHADGTTEPSGTELESQLATTGPAARPGDRVRITDVKITKNSILFEINGGPNKKKKWYEHVSVGGLGGTYTPNTTDTSDNPRGSLLVLEFKDYVPQMTPEQVKQMLGPVLDFSTKSAAEAYLDTIPPKVKEAIKNHQVLVGMDQEMVVYAKGRPPRKIRETDDQGTPYEEWIYGQPPQDVEFVRFEGREVVRLEIMKVDGEKIVRTEKEVEVKQASAKKEEPPPPRPAKAPTLRRPGEDDAAQQDPNVVRVPVGAQDPADRDPTMGPPPPSGPKIGPSGAPPPPGTAPDPGPPR